MSGPTLQLKEEVMNTDSRIYLGAAAIGVVAGMRSMSAPALISQVARNGALEVTGSKIAFLNRTGALSTTGLLALGEFVADKLPFTPARTKAGSVAVRAISGALSGGVLCSARKKSPWLGALIGASAAVGATYAAYHLRRTAEARLNLPDPVLAVAEDALVATSALLIASALRKDAV
jgi:uncharacterized membrane protein